MERHFDQELTALKDELILMGARAEAIVHKAMEAVQRRDERLAGEAIADDRAVDLMEVDVEERCVNLLALRQPMAADLRFLAASLKLSNDLERVGDHGVNIAGNARRLCHLVRLPLPQEIPDLAAMTTNMLRDALSAFVQRDAVGARALVLRDEYVDDLNRKIFNNLLTMMRTDPEGLACYLEWIMIARNLERVADLATNIAEEVVYITEARIIRHNEDKVARERSGDAGQAPSGARGGSM